MDGPKGNTPGTAAPLRPSWANVKPAAAAAKSTATVTPTTSTPIAQQDIYDQPPMEHEEQQLTRNSSPVGVPALPAAPPPGGYSKKEAARLYETIVQILRRPGICTSGEPTTVLANTLNIELTNPNGAIHVYDFRATGDIAGPRLRTLFHQWRSTSYLPTLTDVEAVQVEHMVFDNKHFLYLPHAMPGVPEDGSVVQWDVGLRVGGPGGNRQQQQQQQTLRVHTVKVRKVSAMPMEVLKQYLHGQVSHEHSIWQYLQAFDSIFRHSVFRRLTTQGRVLLDHRNETLLPTGLAVVPGYTQAIRVAGPRIVLIIDVTSAVLYQPLPLSDLLGRAFDRDLMQVNLAPHEIDRAEYVFRSFSVFPNYGATSSSDGADAHEAAEPAALPLAPTTALGSMRKKTLVISGFTRTSAANTPFTLNGRAMTVAQYYAEAHGIRLRAPHLPCAMVQAGKLRRAPGQDRISSARLGATDASNPETIYLPLELATMAPSQKASRPLGRIDHNAFKVSALSPHDRAAHIVRAGRAIYDPPLSLLVAYGLQPQFELTAAPARQLLAPTLLFHPTSQEPTLVPTQGRWDMSVHKLYRPAEGGIRRWAVLPFVPCDPKLVNRFMTRLSQRLRMFGVHVEDRDPPILPPCDPGMGKEMLRTAVRHAYLQAGAEAQHPDVLVFVLPNRGFELYHELKRICDTELGVVSQCLTLKVAQDSRPTHVENIALKLNVKLPGRGQNFAVDPAQLLALQEVPTMFMGADVTHPAQEIRSPSIASVVGSMDRYGARYACATRIQPIRAEIILDIGSMVVELLQKFYMSTGCKPQRIMFFRDGISESQFSDVMRCEVAAIRKAFRAMDPEYKPLLTFMVVQKRHHTRFFAVAPEQADPRTGNLPPGLFVDSETAHPFEFDFYIQSHSTLQGLAKPTRYSVLVDESKFAPNDLAELCWRQCFLYPRGSRSVSMVPAGFYAHVTAARAKAHVVDGEQDGQRYFALQVVKPGLEGTMYFM